MAHATIHQAVIPLSVIADIQATLREVFADKLRETSMVITGDGDYGLLLQFPTELAGRAITMTFAGIGGSGPSVPVKVTNPAGLFALLMAYKQDPSQLTLDTQNQTVTVAIHSKDKDGNPVVEHKPFAGLGASNAVETPRINQSAAVMSPDVKAVFNFVDDQDMYLAARSGSSLYQCHAVETGVASMLAFRQALADTGLFGLARIPDDRVAAVLAKAAASAAAKAAAPAPTTAPVTTTHQHAPVTGSAAVAAPAPAVAAPTGTTPSTGTGQALEPGADGYVVPAKVKRTRTKKVVAEVMVQVVDAGGEVQVVDASGAAPEIMPPVAAPVVDSTLEHGTLNGLEEDPLTVELDMRHRNQQWLGDLIKHDQAIDQIIDQAGCTLSLVTGVSLLANLLCNMSEQHRLMFKRMGACSGSKVELLDKAINLLSDLRKAAG